ncbi:unnamed protein product [Closterium sp. Naga37s-1]|nr:unnamed protein product [Closterium sp. Naga37s-1]
MDGAETAYSVSMGHVFCLLCVLRAMCRCHAYSPPASPSSPSPLLPTSLPTSPPPPNPFSMAHVFCLCCVHRAMPPYSPPCPFPHSSPPPSLPHFPFPSQRAGRCSAFAACTVCQDALQRAAKSR